MITFSGNPGNAVFSEIPKLVFAPGAISMLYPAFLTIYPSPVDSCISFAKMAAKYFNNAEIIELHHNQKKDANFE